MSIHLLLIFSINYLTIDPRRVTMNIIKYFFCSKYQMGSNDKFRSKIWSFEIKQKIDEHETRSYSLTIQKQIH